MSTQAASTLHRAPPRWHRRKEARPREIVSAALDLFVERGYAATKIEDVARRAGVSKGTMYLYFDSKEALFKEVVRASVVTEIERAEQKLRDHRGSAAQLLEELIEMFWSVIGESRSSGLPKLMIGEATHFPELARFWYEEVVRRSRDLLGTAIQLGINLGEFRPLDVSLAVRLALAPLIHASVMKHSFHRCTYEPADQRALVRTHIALFLRGIAHD